MLTIVFND